MRSHQTSPCNQVRIGSDAHHLAGLVALVLVMSGCATSAVTPPTVATSAAATSPLPPALTSEMLTEIRRQAKDVGPLWRIEKDARVSWLYGTIHTGMRAWAVPGPAVMQALQSSTVLAVERVDATPLLEPLAARPPAAAAVIAPGLQQRNAALVDQLVEAHYCLAPGLLNQVPRSLPDLASLVVARREQQRDGFYEEFGLDAVLRRVAGDQNKPILGLERDDVRAQLLQEMGWLEKNRDRSRVGSGGPDSRDQKGSPTPSPQSPPALAQSGLRNITLALNYEIVRTRLGWRAANEAGATNQWPNPRELETAVLNDLRVFDRATLKARAQNLELATAWARLDPADCPRPVWWCDSETADPDGAAERQFNLKREAAMAEAIVREHNVGQQLFVAVGAFHVRPQALPALLTRHGFRVRYVQRDTNAAPEQR
jgi:uncharacterized protein YbaP (TraB family)